MREKYLRWQRVMRGERQAILSWCFCFIIAKASVHTMTEKSKTQTGDCRLFWLSRLRRFPKPPFSKCFQSKRFRYGLGPRWTSPERSVYMGKRFPYRSSQSWPCMIIHNPYSIIKCADVPLSLSFPRSIDHSGFCEVKFPFLDTNFC